MDFMSMRKGAILNKTKADSFRFVVVDYDYKYVYCIDLNDNNKVFRKIVRFTYEECNRDLRIE